MFFFFFFTTFYFLFSHKTFFSFNIGIYISFFSWCFLFFFHSLGSSNFFSSLIFLTFMVLDSVFGICLLINSSRDSSYFMDFYLNF